MIENNRKKSQNLLIKLLLLILMTTTLVIHPVWAQIKSPNTKENMSPGKSNIEEGKVIFQGTKGQYTGYVIAQANLTSIWKILTDYDNFEKYMPNVVESNLLENRGHQKIFEQVQVFKLLMFTRKAKVKIIVTENYPELITFEVIEGDVKNLQGSWKIEPIGFHKYLITHQVMMEPDIQSRLNRDLFFAVYEDTLQKTLAVISQESGKHSGL